MGAAVEVQRALFTALSAAGLRVYDAAHQDATWPYVEVGYIVMSENDTQTTAGFDFLARIHTRVSSSSSNLEAKGIQDQIYGVLHRKPLTITGQNTILMMREMSDCNRAPDGSIHGVCEYRGLTETL
jgi:hypothetical protein